MKNAEIVAELLGIKNPIIRASCYAGWEICWVDSSGTFYVITFVDSARGAFCYTKNPINLPGSWEKIDYWFLYLS